MKNLFLMDDDAMTVINQNPNNEDGTKTGVLIEVHDMMLSVLGPGPLLDDLNRNILNQVLPDVNNLAKTGPTKTKLWFWLRHHFSIASTTAIWGPQNPFLLHPDVERDFWDFEAAAMPLTMMPYPRLLARRGYNARDRVFKAFEEYAEKRGYDDKESSQLVKNRAKINMGQFGLSQKMYAWGEASLLFGVLLNTIPAAFWLISWIFEDAALLHDIRAEVDGCTTTVNSDSTKRTINATKLRTSCPLLASAFRETLRLVGAVHVNRYVTEDTTVTNTSTGETYLLKKDSIIQIASNVIHARPFWGPDAASFNARRFMATGEKARNEAGTGKPPDPAAPFRSSDGKVYSSAFRSFGGGNNICPGRHFAQTEILGLTSLFVAGFEIENASGGGGYRMPPYEDFKLMLGVLKPGKDVDVVISRRKGYENVKWAFEM
jgi:cytochrome P450